MPEKVELSVLIDTEVSNSQWVNFFPMSDDHCTIIRQSGLKKIMKLAGKRIKSCNVMDLPDCDS